MASESKEIKSSYMYSAQSKPSQAHSPQTARSAGTTTATALITTLLPAPETVTGAGLPVDDAAAALLLTPGTAGV